MLSGPVTVIPNQGAAKIGISAFLFMFYFIQCNKLSFLIQQVYRQIFLRFEGCRKPKKVEKHWSRL
jgi:hypothetical protein